MRSLEDVRLIAAIEIEAAELDQITHVEGSSLEVIEEARYRAIVRRWGARWVVYPVGTSLQEGRQTRFETDGAREDV